jgi:hypothetical protein
MEGWRKEIHERCSYRSMKHLFVGCTSTNYHMLRRFVFDVPQLLYASIMLYW